MFSRDTAGPSAFVSCQNFTMMLLSNRTFVDTSGILVDACYTLLYYILTYACNKYVAANIQEYFLDESLISTRLMLQHGVGVEFVRVLPETHPPTLSNIFCECDSKDDVVGNRIHRISFCVFFMSFFFFYIPEKKKDRDTLYTI